MTSSTYSRARKTAGEVGFWAVLVCSIFVYPTELNELLGISSLLAPGELLNGPNDWTLLVRASLVSCWRGSNNHSVEAAGGTAPNDGTASAC